MGDNESIICTYIIFFSFITRAQILIPKNIKKYIQQMLIESGLRAEIWKRYFEKWQNVIVPVQPVVHTEYKRAEPNVKDVVSNKLKQLYLA